LTHAPQEASSHLWRVNSIRLRKQREKYLGVLVLGKPLPQPDLASEAISKAPTGKQAKVVYRRSVVIKLPLKSIIHPVTSAWVIV
jgi:hypothetical protein